MTPHPEDTPVNRFLTFWWALAVFVSFGVLTWVVAVGIRSCGSGGDQTYDAEVIAERTAKLAAVNEAQAKVEPLADEVIPQMVKELSQAKAGPTSIPVPGTQAALDAMKQQQQQLAADAPAVPAAPVVDEKKAEPKPAAKPEAKPTAKPKPKPKSAPQQADGKKGTQPQQDKKPQSKQGDAQGKGKAKAKAKAPGKKKPSPDNKKSESDKAAPAPAPPKE